MWWWWWVVSCLPSFLPSSPPYSPSGQSRCRLEFSRAKWIVKRRRRRQVSPAQINHSQNGLLIRLNCIALREGNTILSSVVTASSTACRLMWIQLATANGTIQQGRLWQRCPQECSLYVQIKPTKMEFATWCGDCFNETDCTQNIWTTLE